MPQPDKLDTPCVLIDLDKVERNLAKAQKHFNGLSIALRPHSETHKLPLFAKNQIAMGAIGITCQKLGEAEVMADAGIEDIFVPFNIVGGDKLERLRTLSKRIKLQVTADSAKTVAGYAATFEKTKEPLTVLVECDTGAGWCGVQSPPAALAMARLIAQHKGLRFGGLMSDSPPGGAKAATEWLREAVDGLSELGLKPERVSVGSTRDMWHRWPGDLVNEFRPDSFIYMDRYQVAAGTASYEQCALTVLTTVVSRPTEKRAIVDAGSNALTSKQLGLDGYGYIPEFPHAEIVALGEGHGIVELPSPTARPQIGSIIEIIPNHVCPVSNLFDRVHLTRRGRLVDTVLFAARSTVS